MYDNTMMDTKKWYTDCSVDIDIISQESFTDNDKQYIKIRLIRPNQDRVVLCYSNVDDIFMHMKNTTMLSNWTPITKMNAEIDPEGKNGTSGWLNLIKLPWEFDVTILLPADNIITTDKFLLPISAWYNEYVAIQIATMRIGNSAGSFGIGQIHGQNTNQIYQIIPRDIYDRNPRAMLQELLIQKLQCMNEMCGLRFPVYVLQSNSDVNMYGLLGDLCVKIVEEYTEPFAIMCYLINIGKKHIKFAEFLDTMLFGNRAELKPSIFDAFGETNMYANCRNTVMINDSIVAKINEQHKIDAEIKSIKNQISSLIADGEIYRGQTQIMEHLDELQDELAQNITKLMRSRMALTAEIQSKRREIKEVAKKLGKIVNELLVKKPEFALVFLTMGSKFPSWDVAHNRDHINNFISTQIYDNLILSWYGKYNPAFRFLENMGSLLERIFKRHVRRLTKKSSIDDILVLLNDDKLDKMYNWYNSEWNTEHYYIGDDDMQALYKNIQESRYYSIMFDLLNNDDMDMRMVITIIMLSILYDNAHILAACMSFLMDINGDRDITKIEFWHDIYNFAINHNKRLIFDQVRTLCDIKVEFKTTGTMLNSDKAKDEVVKYTAPSLPIYLTSVNKKLTDDQRDAFCEWMYLFLYDQFTLDELDILDSHLVNDGTMDILTNLSAIRHGKISDITDDIDTATPYEEDLVFKNIIAISNPETRLAVMNVISEKHLSGEKLPISDIVFMRDIKLLDLVLDKMDNFGRVQALLNFIDFAFIPANIPILSIFAKYIPGDVEKTLQNKFDWMSNEDIKRYLGQPVVQQGGNLNEIGIYIDMPDIEI